MVYVYCLLGAIVDMLLLLSTSAGKLAGSVVGFCLGRLESRTEG